MNKEGIKASIVEKKKKNKIKLDHGDGHKFCKYPKNHWICTLKMHKFYYI